MTLITIKPANLGGVRHCAKTRRRSGVAPDIAPARRSSRAGRFVLRLERHVKACTNFENSCQKGLTTGVNGCILET
jgi:hypothetical protein